MTLNDKEWGLLNFISKSSSKVSLDNLKQTRNGLFCLSQIIKTHNIELRYWAKETSHLLLRIINQYKNFDDLDNIEVVCDILDASLTALSFTIKTFSKELRNDMDQKDSPYTSFLKELIEFNVEGMMSYAGEDV